MAGLVLKEVPLSPAMQYRPSYSDRRPMTGRASGLIIRMPCQLPRTVLRRMTGKRLAILPRHNSMYS